ncbi:hypothetical protein AVEN_194337-1 [Araneus ventricosus]|uniref:Uncharacterized protein n=1 Tax=Araneus ventricosus TaxID=182803 RepID=A0A4Y2PUP7_ARAVE|nr:hypothetical protein AVEN_194337-1 [Araneus ventricosus]
MKKFITAERCGDWNDHLFCAQQMITFFHASGHFQYAKWIFTINRSGSLCAEVWSDMVIEKTLMRSMKSSGGMTRGRGFSDSVLAKWVGGSSAVIAICSSVEEFAGTVFSSGEQHIDFRVPRRKRDEQDRFKIYEWFVNHPPFSRIAFADVAVDRCHW